jgi:hypothetical protein
MASVGERGGTLGAMGHRGGGGASVSSGWRREGERDPQPVGRLGMLAARWVGLKATGPKGRAGRWGSWADWARS